MWKVRLYKSTGFNLINVPDDPDLLEQKPHKNFGVIDCLQRFFLSYITIRAYEDDVILGDFLKLYDDENENNYAYYVVNGYTMTSGDTVQLDVAMEPLLTCGGIDNITIVDGMVSRHHLSQTDIENNMIPTEDDPLLVPTKIYVKPVAYYANGEADHIFEHFGGASYDLILRCMISKSMLTTLALSTTESILQDMMRQNINFNYDDNTKLYHGVFDSGCALKLMDDWSSQPQTERDLTPVYLDKRSFNSDYSELGVSGQQHLADGAHYILANYSTTPGGSSNEVLDYIAKLIEWGRSDYILDAYYVPAVCTDYAQNTGVDEVHCIVDDPLYIVPDYQQVYGGMITILDDDEFKIIDPESQGYSESGQSVVHNKRILMGKHHAYNFVSPDNGQVVTVNPEDIFVQSRLLNPDDSPMDYAAQYPRIKFSIDKRPGGNMVFKILRPESPYLVPTGTEKSLSPIVITTGPWDTANIALLASAGKNLKTMNYLTESGVKDAAVAVNSQFEIENKTRGLRAFNPIAHISSAIHRGYYGGEGNMSYVGDPRNLGSIGNAYVGAAAGNEYDKARYDRLMQKEAENMQFVNSLVPQPQIVSKASGSSLFTGQGLVVYRNYVSKDDLRRFDKILNKYGCKHVTEFTDDMLTNRPRFNYIETQGVSIKCPTVPKSVRDELANAFNTGLRIWHVKDVDPNAWNDPVEEES